MAEITPFYEKTEECPLCKKIFTTTKIRSRFIKVASYDTDFSPVYQDSEINPIVYFVNVCPHCGYSYTEEFSRYFPPAVLNEIKEKVCSRWVYQDYGKRRSIKDGINSYKLAYYCATLKHEKNVTMGGLALRTAWLYRLLKIQEEENRFLEMAGKQYEDSYSKGDFSRTKMSEIKLLYLIGELKRRLGHYKEATFYFSKVIERQKFATEPKILEMAKNQWQMIRQTME
ncbi:DUF2225 domain-containing protein [Bacillus smithii]|uniref:DUF2225 domain-containing protein n=1 Tax=Bacillus smithii TaxID=1479 RepID=UPI003D2615E7